MEFAFNDGKIIFERELSNLDKLVLKFVRVLDGLGIDYVIISGYVAILFGRSRATEDVDLFIREMPFEKFMQFWAELEKNGFECLNTRDPMKAFNEYLNGQLALRFASVGTFIPNFELKYPKSKYNIYSLNHKVVVVLNGREINTSELELQIAFKLNLGSEKDFEDARHLFNVFKSDLNMNLLRSHVVELKVEKQAEKVLWKKRA